MIVIQSGCECGRVRVKARHRQNEPEREFERAMTSTVRAMVSQRKTVLYVAPGGFELEEAHETNSGEPGRHCCHIAAWGARDVSVGQFSA